MKKIIKILTFSFISYFIILGSVNAASLSLSKSSSSVTTGNTVKITARVSGGKSYTYSNFTISYDQDRFSFVSSSDNCNGLNCLIEGNGSVTLTFKAKSTGSGTFRASGSYEDDSSGGISSSTTVTVGQYVPPKILNSNNYLSSLSIKGYDLNPKFDKDTLEYTINLPGGTTNIEVTAEVAEKTSRVNGTGTLEVSEGKNTKEIVVTAENGNTKTYTLKINVDEKDPIKTKINNQEYTVVRDKDLLTKPENYEEKTIKIGDKEVPVFYNEITKYTLVGLKDSKGKVALYIYNEKENKYSLYKELKFNSIVLYPMDINKSITGYKEYDVDFDGITIKGLKVKKNSAFAIIYGMDVETGKEDYYMYDIDNNTLQLYNDEYAQSLLKEQELYSYIILGSWGLLGIFLIVIIILCIKNSKRKKKIRNILNKLSPELNIEEQVVDTEEVVDEVLENKEDEEMYDLFDEKQQKAKKAKNKNKKK